MITKENVAPPAFGQLFHNPRFVPTLPAGRISAAARNDCGNA